MLKNKIIDFCKFLMVDKQITPYTNNKDEPLSLLELDKYVDEFVSSHTENKYAVAQQINNIFKQATNWIPLYTAQEYLEYAEKKYPTNRFYIIQRWGNNAKDE